MSDIKPGDVVRLKSGGPRMVVETIIQKAALVTWMSEDGHAENARFHVDALIPVGDDDVVLFF